MFKRKKQHHTSYLLGGAAGGFILGIGMYALTSSKAIKKTNNHTASDRKNHMTETMVEAGDDIVDGMKEVVNAAINEPTKKKKEAKEPELAKIIQKSLDHDPF
ncbi:hypothetical protein [Alkalicoccobacillus porphyridii]|uniref:Uncharacterized protein n=1 Tax=Alkalicoccobacillus porphyridii TaxID=2597270 RepID=A0A553ZV73_9BACI|nr:hypothetical protein [Alkalicoccobacillus porphyridii]TSB45322.1 hypothetical protein FN960_16615 [Alkalicoccobacillus porphyridii]